MALPAFSGGSVNAIGVSVFLAAEILIFGVSAGGFFTNSNGINILSEASIVGAVAIGRPWR